jgi:hypothetical protein
LRERDVAAALVVVERFAAGGHDPIVDRYGRFHYGLSSLPSVARSCVTYKKQPLVFLDIACSQPFFLVQDQATFCSRSWEGSQP